MSEFTPAPQNPPIELTPAAPRVKRPRKGLIIAAATIATFVIGYAIVGVSTVKPPDQAKVDEAEARPGQSLNELPSTYASARAELAKREAEERARFLASRNSDVPLLGPPRPGDMGVVQLDTERRLGIQPGGASTPPTAEQQALAQMRAEQARVAQQAQAAAYDSPLNFDLPNGAMQHAQANASSYTTPNPTAINAQGETTDQDRKREFLRTRDSTDPFLNQTVYAPPTKDFVASGTIIPALLITGLNSDLPGQIVAQVSQGVYDTPSGKHLLIPQGTRVIGEYDSNVAYGQNRVLVVWTQLQFPNGSTFDLTGMPGTDLSGYAGVRDQVNNHFVRLAGAVVLGSLLSAATADSANYSLTGEVAYEDRARERASQQIGSAADRITQRNLDIQPTLIVRPGKPIGVFLTRHIALPVYGG